MAARRRISPKWQWYLRAQVGVLLYPLGLPVWRSGGAARLHPPEPWFWIGTLSLICINAGIGLMIESGLLRGYPRP